MLPLSVSVAGQLAAASMFPGFSIQCRGVGAPRYTFSTKIATSRQPRAFRIQDFSTVVTFNALDFLKPQRC